MADRRLCMPQRTTHDFRKQQRGSRSLYHRVSGLVQRILTNVFAVNINGFLVDGQIAIMNEHARRHARHDGVTPLTRP